MCVCVLPLQGWIWFTITSRQSQGHILTLLEHNVITIKTKQKQKKTAAAGPRPSQDTHKHFLMSINNIDASADYTRLEVYSSPRSFDHACRCRPHVLNHPPWLVFVSANQCWNPSIASRSHEVKQITSCISLHKSCDVKEQKVHLNFTINYLLYGIPLLIFVI